VEGVGCLIAVREAKRVMEVLGGAIVGTLERKVSAKGPLSTFSNTAEGCESPVLRGLNESCRNR